MLEAQAKKPPISYRDLFRNRNFALLWSAMSISLSGDVLFNLALNWLILEKTGSALSVGGNLIVGVVSDLLFRSSAGALADRWNRRALMMGSDLLRGGVVLGLLILLRTLPFQLGFFYLTTFLLSLFSNFFFPAYRAVLPNLLPQETLIVGRAWTTTSARLITTLVSGGSGFLLAGMGLQMAILLNALSFFLSAILLSQCHIPQAHPLAETPLTFRSLFGNIWEGWGYVSQNRVLLRIFFLTTFGDFGAAFIWPVHVVFVERVLHGGPEFYGMLATASLLGSIAGAWFVGCFSTWFNRHVGRSYFLAAGVWGTGAVLFGLNTFLPLAFVYRFLIGAALSVLSIPLAAWTDAHTEDAVRGRVGAMMSLGSQVVSPLAVTISGWLADMWSPRVSYVTAGSLLLIAALVSLILPGIQSVYLRSQPQLAGD